MGCQPVIWPLPSPHSSQAPPSDPRSCPGRPIWRGWLGMPPLNALRLICLPRAAVKTASTLRRPTEQDTRWAGFPEWSGGGGGCDGVVGGGVFDGEGSWLGHQLAAELRHGPSCWAEPQFSHLYSGWWDHVKVSQRLVILFLL